MKKLTSLLLTFAMLFSLAAPAAAATVAGDTSGDVTASYTPSTEATPEALWGTDIENLTERGTLAQAINAAEADSSITYIQLQTDVTAGVIDCLIASGVFTLDLNGKTLSSTAETINVHNSGTVVTLTDTATGGVVTTTGTGCAAVSADLGGKVVIEGGSYSGSYAVRAVQESIVEIIDGTFTGTAISAVSADDTSTLNIAGGDFSGYFSSVDVNGTTITGGSFTGGNECGAIAYYAGTLDLSGYDAVVGLTLSQWTGGELTVSDENIILPEGYVFQDDAGTPVTTLAQSFRYTVAAEGGSETTIEALWGTSKDDLSYSGTLAQAIDAAETDSSITYIQLQTDVTADDDYGCLIASGVFTLDLNGKTLSSNSAAISVLYSGTVVTLTDTAGGGAVITTDDYSDAINVRNSGKIVIDGGSYSGLTAVRAKHESIVEIIDGTFTGTTGYTVCVEDASTLSIAGGTFSGPWASVVTNGTTTITGGSFAPGLDGHISYYAGTLDLSGYDAVVDLTLSQWTGGELTLSDENIKLPEGYVFQDNAGTPVTTLANGIMYTIAAEGGSETTIEALWGTSKDDLSYSGTLAQAINAAQADSSITYIQLQTDVTADASSGYLIESGVFTLDLNGKTLSSNSAAINVLYSGTVVTLTDTAGGGAVITTSDADSAISVWGRGKVVIDGGTYSGQIAVLASDESVVEIFNGGFTSTEGYAIAVDATSSLNISGGDFSGLWAPVFNNGTTVITGGTFTSGLEGQLSYGTGILDLSGYDKENLNGLTLSQWTGGELTVSDENIKLPEGYGFRDSEGNAVTTLAHGTVYTIVEESGSMPIAKITGIVTVTVTNAFGETVYDEPTDIIITEGDSVTVLYQGEHLDKLTDAYTYDVGALTGLIRYDATVGSDNSTATVTNDATALIGSITHPIAYTNAGESTINTGYTLTYLEKGTELTAIYYKGPWSNILFDFLNSADRRAGNVTASIVETGIYAVTDIPNWAYALVFYNLDNSEEYIIAGNIPTDGRNMYNAFTGEWETYTPSQPPADTASAEISWGSLSFTYTDGENGAEGAWSCEDGANEITVTNTGTTTLDFQPLYEAKDGYTEIQGSFYASMEATESQMFVALDGGESFTFYLKLFNKPSKVLDGDTIATATIRILPGGW